MSLISTTSRLRTFATLLGLVPFTFFPKSNKFILFRYLPISLFKFTLFIIVIYFMIKKPAKMAGIRADHLNHETPMQLILTATRMLTVSSIFIYDIILLIEKNYRKKMYCVAMNELVELSDLVIFKNLKIMKICRKLRRHEWMIITMVILCYCGFFYFGTVVTTGSTINPNVVYFTAHLLMNAIDSLYIGLLFVTLRSFMECLTNRVKKRGEAINKVQLIDIHKRISKVIKQLTKAHGMQILGSYVIIIIFISTSVYLAYAFNTDFENTSSFGIFLVTCNSLFSISFVLTWNLVKVQEMVSLVCQIVLILLKIFGLTERNVFRNHST